MSRPRFLFLTGLVLLAALSRLIPHRPNFAPTAALALFWKITGISVAGAVLFFVVSNLGVWALGIFFPTYPMTLTGLLECYVAAIPSFWNTFLSDLFYAVSLFGTVALAEKRWPVLAEAAPA